MNAILGGRKEDFDISFSRELETQINDCRNTLKRDNINNIDNHAYSYDSGTVYMDLVTEFEKLGDYILNVVEARLGAAKDEKKYAAL